MREYLIANEQVVRLAWFLGGVIIFGLMERLKPRRQLQKITNYRWLNNFALVVVDSLMLRIAFPMLAVAVAFIAEDKGWGLFNQLDWPWYAEVALSIVLLDGIIYFQHILVHKVPVLWRLHRVHHTDTDLDVSSALRFHPIEIALSMVIKMAAVSLLGVSAVGVIIFEIVLNFSAMFNHANWNIGGLDRVMRKLVVSPDMHRIHHSVVMGESMSNYGFFLSIWDRMFGTYKDEPKDGQLKFKIGTNMYRDKNDQRIDQLLAQPFYRSRLSEDLTD